MSSHIYKGGPSLRDTNSGYAKFHVPLLQRFYFEMNKKPGHSGRNQNTQLRVHNCCLRFLSNAGLCDEAKTRQHYYQGS